jgi:hypothetical protein
MSRDIKNILKIKENLAQPYRNFSRVIRKNLKEKFGYIVVGAVLRLKIHIILSLKCVSIINIYNLIKSCIGLQGKICVKNIFSGSILHHSLKIVHLRLIF